MNKFAALLMFFLGASFMFHAIQAEGCTVAYYDIPPPPDCEWDTDAEGEEEEECVTVGSAAFAAALDAATPFINEPNFPLSELDLSGDECDHCTLTVYSKTNLQGCKVVEEVKDDHVDVVPGIWKRNADPKSWSLVCLFR